MKAMQGLSLAAWFVTTSALAGSPALYALPPEAVAVRVLQDLPQLRQVSLNRELAAADQAKLDAGPGEWIVRSEVARRRITGGERYRETEFGVERNVRWFGKAAQDRAIGEQGLAVAAAQRAEAWHEASRTLMQDWYDALRTQAAMQRLADQHALMVQLKTAAERRVRAGDGPALELLQADTAVRQSEALLEQARQEMTQAQLLLSTTYQGLPAPLADQLPEPQPVAAADVASLAADNHELALAQVEAQWYGLKARRADAERMPDPTVAVRVLRERDGEERTVGLSLSIPLPGAARSADASAAAVQLRMADERVALVRNKAQLAAQRAVAEQGHSYRIWSSLREVAAQSMRQAELMERAYQAGESSLTDALLSRRQAFDASLAAQTAQIAALAAGARVQLDAHALWAMD